MAFATFVLFCAPSIAQGAERDPYREMQWGLDVIRAETAWRVSVGRGSVVAVIDTGVDSSHPDLIGRLLPGKDFVDDDDNPDDENGHGTLIAGIIGASTGNGKGVAATAPSSRILPVRALDADGTGSTDDVVASIEWSVDQGADVINLSLAQEGGGDGLLGSDLLADRSVDRAIKDAAARGVTVVVAAGNDHDGGRATTAYDATVDGVLVVGASTKSDARAAYSNYGSGLDLVAPGGGSARDPSRNKGCTDANAIVSTWWDPDPGRAAYGAGCGTSMAVGFVSGVAALLHARGMNNDDIADRLRRTAVDIGPKGRDNATGHGRLDAARALGVKPSVPRVVSSPRAGGVKATGGVATAKPTPKALPSRPEVVRPHAVFGSVRERPVDQERGLPVTTAMLLLAVVSLGHIWRLATRSRVRA